MVKDVLEIETARALSDATGTESSTGSIGSTSVEGSSCRLR
jgi:hypothetical protein